MALKDIVHLHFETDKGAKIVVKARLDQVRLDLRKVTYDCVDPSGKTPLEKEH